MSKVYSIKSTQNMNMNDYNIFDNYEAINNLSPTYIEILKIFKEIFKHVDISKIINDK